MFRRILAPTDGSEPARISTRYAIELAKKYDGMIVALHVVDVKLLEGPFLQDLSASLGTAPYVNYQGNIAMLLDERGKAALAEVDDACGKAGVKCETRLVTGIVVRAILEESGLADLIVMSRGGEHHQWLEGLTGSTTEAVVRRTALPVLVTGVENPGGDRFLLAYDGSEHARHALRTAVSLAVDWDMAFKVLSVGEKHGADRLDEARNYLQNYDVRVEYEHGPGDPGETIAAKARAYQADLVVMGAYGHSKVRELVVGSTTSFVMQHTECPLLLCR